MRGLICTGLVLGCFFAAAPVQGALIQDTFSRLDGSPADDSLGATEVGGYDYSERQTQGGVAHVAAISGGELYVHGAGGGSDPGQAVIQADLPNAIITTDIRFSLSDSVNASTYNNAGFMLRKPRLDADIVQPNSLGQIEVSLFPTGAVFIREQTSSGTVVRYTNNPFALGTDVTAFQPAGTLPTSINGLPFDVNGDGRLDGNEPFQLSAILSGYRLQVLVNDQPILAINTLQAAAATPNNYFALWKNRSTSAGTRTSASPYFDNLVAETPGFVIRHRGDTNPLLENWTLDQTGGAGTFTPGNDGTKHWRITQVDGQRANYQSVLLPEEVNDPAGWTATAVAKVNSASPFNAELAVADGSHFWGVELGGGPGVANVGVFAAVASGNNLRLLSTADPSTDYHTYQMVYRPATQTVSFYRDGVGIGTQGRSELIPTSLRRLSWGDNTGGFGASDSQWAFTQFQVGQIAMTGTVVEHRATANPVTEGFTFSSNGPHTVGPSADGQAWRIQQGPGALAWYRAEPDASNFEHPLGWTLTGMLKVNDAAREFQAYLSADDNVDSWQLNFVGPGAMTPGVYAYTNSGPVLLSDKDPSQAYHLYQIIYDPAGDGGNGLVTYYMDFLPIGTQTRAQASDIAGYRRIVFGDNWSLAGVASDSQWAWVRFETGQNYITPEPSTMVLCGLGLAVLPLAAWRKRRQKRSKEV